MLLLVSLIYEVVWTFYPLMVAYFMRGIYPYEILSETILAVEAKIPAAEILVYI